MERVTRVLDLDLSKASAVLVRFHYTNQNAVPRGLRSIERLSERELLKKRMDAMKTDNASETRGKQVLQNIEQVQIALLRVGLANNGLRLVDAHTFDQRVQGRAKYITTLGFRRLNGGEVAPEIPEEAMVDLRAFSMDAVWLGHIWWNPNGVIVIELMMRQPGVAPKCAFAIRDGGIVVVQTEALLAEKHEDAAVAEELLAELEELKI